MAEQTVRAIGTIVCDQGGMRLVLDNAYAPALAGLDGFRHIQVLWWFSECDNAADRSVLTVDAPYRTVPGTLGTFATRSPMRPNPIALSCAQITDIDHENAVVGLAYIEAFDGSPVLDIKPYTPSLDRVESPLVPAWCRHWPKSYEASADFDWEGEIRA